MKIAIDVGLLKTGDAVRGRGMHTKELVDALQEIAKKDNNLKLDVFDFSENPRKVYSGKYDIVHYSYFFPYFLTLPAKMVGKTVVTIHDLIQLIYPDKYPPGIKGKLRHFIQRNRIKKVDAVVTISETSKKDIIRFLGVPQEKVKVVYLAPRKIFKVIGDKFELRKVTSKYSLPSKFVLYVGDVNYNKNIPLLLKAIKLAKIPLVICGKHAQDVENGEINPLAFTGPRDWLRFLLGQPHPELAHYKKLVSEFKENTNVIRLGFVPDEDLVAIYNLATVYCQPSFYEGFGLPVLEAFACGTPVVISRTQALTEIAGDSVLTTDLHDPKDLAKKLLQLFNDSSLRLNLVRKGMEKVKEFSWDKTATGTIEVYKSVLKNA